MALLLFTLGLAACARAVSSPTTDSRPTLENQQHGILPPYRTVTPSGTAVPPSPLAEIPITPAPTVTPFLHVVIKDDTMLGIAIRYGVSLEELKAANPDADPRMLSIGQELVVPLVKQEDSAQAATPTPASVRLGFPRCYPSMAGGWACMVEAYNDQGVALESISVWFGLYSELGNLLAAQVVVPPLDLLQPGSRIPFQTVFLPPLPRIIAARVEVVTAMAINVELGRYIPTQVQINQVEIDTSGLHGRAQGMIFLERSARDVIGAAVAYDVLGQAVGVRKWKTETGCQELTEAAVTETTLTPGLPSACGPISFDVTVYSLGPQIARLEILVEARP